MKQDGFVKFALLKLLSVAYSWLDVIGVKKAVSVISINPSVGRYIQKQYAVTPASYSYLGVDFTHFKPTRLQKNTKVTFFHSTDYTVLKGTQYLLKALALLKNHADNFNVIISDSISNKSVKSKFQEELVKLGMQNTVIFKDHLPYSELPKVYSSCDAYLFLGSPYSQGASAASLSVLEAQSCGLPVIRSIGNTDEVIPNKTGFLVDPTKPKELATIMLFVIKNRKKVASFSPEALKHVQKYSWDKVTKTFQDQLRLLN